MKHYLVGGAVRDELLGLPVHERDWLVVGSTPEEMLAQGYQPVGKDFPVFLHPVTHEEYALARTERKTAPGYKGFVCHADPNVSIEDDLKRRDLTINAIAKNSDGTLIDPYHGQDDLIHKILKHVSPAFSEDPIRILRVARFASKLPDFTIDPTTTSFMRTMVNNGEINALTPERVFQELKRSLTEKNPNRFFEVLAQCGALPILFPWFNDVPDVAIKELNALQRFSVLMQALNNDAIKACCKHYHVPSDYTDLAVLIKQVSNNYQLLTKNPAALLSFLKRCDALRRPDRFNQMLPVLIHYYKINHTNLLKTSLTAIKNINTKPLQDQHLKGHDFLKALEVLQLNAISSAHNI